jgi:hypothetical protein
MALFEHRSRPRNGKPRYAHLPFIAKWEGDNRPIGPCCTRSQTHLSTHCRWTRANRRWRRIASRADAGCRANGVGFRALSEPHADTKVTKSPGWTISRYEGCLPSSSPDAGKAPLRWSDHNERLSRLSTRNKSVHSPGVSGRLRLGYQRWVAQGWDWGGSRVGPPAVRGQSQPA